MRHFTLLAALLALPYQHSVILSEVEHGFIVRNAVEGPRFRRSHLNTPAHSGDELQSSPQQPTANPQSPFAQLIAEYLRQDANGHSPSADEIATMQTLTPQPDPTSLREALPLLLKALENPDTPLRTFALTTLIGLRAAPTAPANAESAPVITPVFKLEIAKVLVPALAPILAHLTDDSAENRQLTVTFISGFDGNPPAALFPPLIAYLKSDAGVSQTGLGVTQALLGLGSISSDTADAIARFLRRPDQRDLRSELVDAISTAPNQSQPLNAALLRYLDADDASLRARLILSLPALDLAPDVFADTKSRVEQLAANPSESLQVVTAAKSVAPCWTATKMTTGCPVY